MTLESILVVALLLILGFALSFKGYKWFMILLPILAFITGFNAGANAVSSVFGLSIISSLVIAFAGLILGLLLAVIVYLSFNLAVILLGALFGYTLGSGFVSLIGLESGLIQIVAGLIVAIITAIIAIRLNLPRYLIIVLTSFLGTEFILVGMLLLMGSISIENVRQGSWLPSLMHSNSMQLLMGFFSIENVGSWWSSQSLTRIFIVIWLIFAGLSALVQLRNAKYYELDLPTCAIQASD